MTSAVEMLGALERQRPEWAPWLAVVSEVLQEVEGGRWAAVVPATDAAPGDAPRLSGATATVPRALASRLFERLVRAASRSGTAKMATLARAAADADAIDLLGASVRHDERRIAGVAAASCADPEAFQAVAALLPVPFLQACNSQWASAVTQSWVRPCCPICGSRPAFAEVRGIERSRFYRCGRCGSEWHAHGLSCPYCATTNHRDLVELVPEKPGADGLIQACTRCHGYVKTYNRLQRCDPAAVVVADLQGAALDVAALEQGYARPAGAGCALDFTVAEPARRRTFAWNG